MNFDGTILAHGTSGRPDEIITAEVRPDLVREARAHWSVENNIYQLGHRGFTAVAVAPGLPLHLHAGPRRGTLPSALGRQRAVRRRHVVWISEAGAPLRRAPRPRRGVTMRTIPADPYPWPFDGDLTPQNTALIIIDMQTDFCGKGGYVDNMGYDLSLTRAPIEPIRAVLDGDAREGLPHLPHARRPSPRPDRPAGQQTLALAPDRRRHRRSRTVRPHPGARRAGWDIIPELYPERRASRSSTSQAKARSAPPTSS